MTPRGPAVLALLWHMHQPDYRDHATGEFVLPWVYLHAIKDYADMAWHLEHHPGIRAVVNFTPVLLAQLEDYREQFATGRLRDPLLRLLGRGAGHPLDEGERALVLERCVGPGHERMFRSFAAYRGLREILADIQAHGPMASRYLSDQYLHDLLSWYHLAWMGETVRRSSPTVTRLMSIGQNFTAADRAELLALVGELVSGIVPRFARLGETGRIELSTSPEAHPLGPLLLSLESALESQAQSPLPASPQYPGGRERLTAQLRAARQAHERAFGLPPAGLWPPEAAISASLLALIAEDGWAWTASAQSVLDASLRAGGQAVDRGFCHRPYRLEGLERGPVLFFRHDRLSDLIGFEYAQWNSQDAAANFIAALETIEAAPGAEPPVIGVMLDGENCWEHYDYNGYYFLEELYRRIEAHPGIRTATLRECAAERGATAAPLRRIAAGSWMQGTLATWIGSPDKNRAWDLLCAAKQSYDLVLASGRLDAARRREAERQLTACEGSDWFWWLGREHPGAEDLGIDALFRRHLANLYRLLGLPVPESLSQPIRHAPASSHAPLT